MRRRAAPFLLAAVLGVLGAAGCGDETPPAPGPWSSCVLTGLEEVSGAAVLGDDLVLCQGGGRRAIHVVGLAALVTGGRVRPRALRVDVDPKAPVTGRELLAERGYTIGDLWGASVDLEAIAVQSPDLLFVADRAFRVVYWGRVVRDVGGAHAIWQLRRGFEVPGARRSRKAEADYRDLGPGLSGMLGVSGRARTEDLYVAERARAGGPEVASQFRVLVLDRYGGLGGGGKHRGLFAIDVGEGQVPGIEALAYETANRRFLCLRAAGRGAIAPFQDPGSLRTGKLGRGVPTPRIEGAGPWRALTVGPDGTWYLVSSGPDAVVAWRTP